MIETITDFFEQWPWFIIALIVGIVTLLFGGHLLVEGAVILARRFGLSTLIIGLTVVAFGTSAPELAFNVIAAIDGSSDLSFGNIVGSNLANIGLVLGISALIAPLAIHAGVMRRDLPSVLLISIGFLCMARFFPSVETVGGDAVPGFARMDGGILLIGFSIFLLVMFRQARADRAEAARLTEEAGIDESHPPTRGPIFACVVFLLGLVLLLLGGKMSQIGAVGLARSLGLSEVVIALTVIAFATSLPELATSIIAAAKGHSDLAVGNIIGSNIFNILLVMGTTSVIAPVRVPTAGMEDLWWMMGLTVLVVAIALAGRRRIPRTGGLILLGSYAAYMAFLYFTKVLGGIAT